MQVGFIGLGAMGTAMARNLVNAGHEVKAWNRSGNPGVENIEFVDDVSKVLQGDAAFTMLSDDPAIRAVLLENNAIETARKGLVHVMTSTISIGFSQELASLHKRLGVGYVAAPVLGRPDVAAKGELNILAAGQPEMLDRVMPLLDVLGRKVWNLGTEPKQANAAKVAANMMITMAIEAMGEAVSITEANGLSRDLFFDLITNTLFAGRAYQTYSANIAKSNYEPGFKARLGLKDLRLATTAAQEAGYDLPMLNAVRGRLGDAVDAGLGERDWSIMADVTLKSKA